MYIHYTKQLYDFLVISDRAQSNMVWNLQNKLCPPHPPNKNGQWRKDKSLPWSNFKPTLSFDELFWQQYTEFLPTLIKRQEKQFTAQHHHLAAQSNGMLPRTSKVHHALPTTARPLLYDNAGWSVTGLRHQLYLGRNSYQDPKTGAETRTRTSEGILASETNSCSEQ